jgi:hypothetical protein
MSRDPHPFDPLEARDVEGRPPNGRRPSPSHELQRDTDTPAIHAEHRAPAERPAATQRQPERLDSPRAHYLGERTYFVRDSELQTMAEVGTFRVVAAADLARLSYGGDTQRMDREIRRLKEQSLISENAVPGDRNKTIRVLALTKKGARLLRHSGLIPEAQAIYHRFVKPREAKHDADLYRLYHAQLERIERAGGRATRVVLDYELKRNLNRDLATLPLDQQTPEARKQIAERHGLTVVDGKIPVPDLRVEYETADMERKHLDLELATRNYRPRALAEKAKAGFSFYARREDASRLRRVLDEREITAAILSL